MDREVEMNTLLVDTYKSLMCLEEKMLNKTRHQPLSINEVHTIEIVGRSDGRTITDIAKDMDLTLSSVTVSVARLEKKGYVERRRISDDRRYVHVFLTDIGVKVYKLHKRFHKRMTSEMLEGFSSEEEEILLSAVKRLNSFFKKRVLTE